MRPKTEEIIKSLEIIELSARSMVLAYLKFDAAKTNDEKRGAFDRIDALERSLAQAMFDYRKKVE